MKRAGTWALGLLVATWAGQVRAGDTLAVVMTQVDPPTLIHLGVQVQISDDDDRDATISVRWRGPAARGRTARRWCACATSWSPA
jgi:hypothetical protein